MTVAKLGLSLKKTAQLIVTNMSRRKRSVSIQGKKW